MLLYENKFDHRTLYMCIVRLFDHFRRARTHTRKFSFYFIFYFISFRFIVKSQRNAIRIECTSSYIHHNSTTPKPNQMNWHSNKHNNSIERKESIRVVWFHLVDIAIFLYTCAWSIDGFCSCALVPWKVILHWNDSLVYVCEIRYPNDFVNKSFLLLCAHVQLSIDDFFVFFLPFLLGSAYLFHEHIYLGCCEKKRLYRWFFVFMMDTQKIHIIVWRTQY